MLQRRRPSLHELLTRFRRDRDDAAMEEFVANTRPRLLAIARRIGARQDGEDSVQAAYHALLARPDSAPEINPEAWLTTTVVRIAYRRKAVARRDARVAELLARARSDCDPAAAANRNDEAAVLQQGVIGLPSRYRDPIVLHHLEGLPVIETARLLDCPVPTVKTRLRRGRALLRGRLPHSLARALFAVPWLLADAARAGSLAPIATGGGIVKAKTAVITATLALATGVGGYLAGTQASSNEEPVRSGSRPAAPEDDRAPRESKQSSFAALVASVPIPPTPTGTGKITGRITTPDGQGVAGATVTAHPGWTPEGGQDWFKQNQSVEDYARGMVAYRKWGEAVRRTTISEADGRYEVQGLVSKGYTLGAECTGYQIRVKRGMRSHAQPGATVDFEAQMRVDVHTQVVGIDGKTPEYVSVYYRLVDGNVGYAGMRWRAAHPTLQFPVGKLSIYAVAPPGAEGKSETVEVTFARSTDATLTLRLKGRPGVRGKVVLPPDLKPEYTYVFLGTYDGEAPPKGPVETRGMKQESLPEASGHTFEFKDVEPGRYLIGVSLDRRTLESPEVIDIPDRMIEHDVRFPSLDPKLYRVVRVLSANGKPVPVRSFMVRWDGTRGSAVHGASSVGRADGSHLVRVRLDSRAPVSEDTRYKLTVHTSKHGDITRRYDPDEPGEFVVRVVDPATLHVTLDGYRGSGYEGKLSLQVMAAGEPDIQRGVQRGGLSSLGKQTLGPVQCGEAVLLIGSKQGMLFWIVQRVPLTLKPGDNTINLPIPPIYSLRLRGRPRDRFAVGPAEKEEVLRYFYVQLDDKGEAEVTGFGPGRYKAWGRRDGKDWKREFTLPGTSVLEIE